MKTTAQKPIELPPFPGQMQHALWLHVESLRRVVAELAQRARMQVITAAPQTGDVDQWHVENNKSVVIGIVRTPQIAEWIAAKELLALIESSDDYKAAEAECRPYLDALAAQKAAEAVRIEAARRELEDAEAARNAAATRLQTDPELIAAQERVEKARAGLEAAHGRAPEPEKPTALEAYHGTAPGEPNPQRGTVGKYKL